MRKFIHLVPYDGIGGVETAARSMAGYAVEGIDFQVAYIYPIAAVRRGRFRLFNPWAILQAARRVIADQPDCLIVSLWRSCLVGLLAKLFRPRLQLVLFLHAPRDFHWLDRLSTRWVAALACQTWADSEATLTHRLPTITPEKGRVISFVSRRTAPLPTKAVNAVFIFWGRLHTQKGLNRALGLFAAIHQQERSARFMIIGPDGGERARIGSAVHTLGLTDAVHIAGALDFSSIVSQAGTASFYLQTSSTEGMAMSVVEAMQHGLVPLVTPVGEIARYCRHGENALLVDSDETAVANVLEVLHDDARYQTLRKNAVATWADKPLYGDSVLDACKQLCAG